jgi:hypothetical protein
MDPAPPTPVVRSRLALFTAVVLLGCSAGYGFLSGLTESGGESPAQQISTWTELAYGALAGAGIIALLLPRLRWLAQWILYAWAVLWIATIPLGAVVWGGAGVGPAAGLGVGAAAVAGVVLWLAARSLARAP